MAVTRWLTIAVLTFATLATGCPGPTDDLPRLRAVKAEAERLMATYPVDPKEGWADIPPEAWPSALASLRPELVMVRRDKVLIITKGFFDGGWGYDIPRTKGDLGKLAECYSQIVDGVFWHGPC